MSMTPSRRAIEAMTLGGMALDNRTIVTRCYGCRRTGAFLASDLARVYGGSHSPHTLFTRCSRCGGAIRVDFGFPSTGQTIRRPVETTAWKWRDEIYDAG